MMDHQFACGIHLFQHRPGRAGLTVPLAAPMDHGMPVHLPLHRQRVGIDRAVFPEILPGPFFHLRKTLELPAALPGAAAVALEIGPVLCWKDRQILIGIIHQQPVTVQKLPEGLLRKALYPGLQRQLGVFAAHVHRVELDAARLTHKIIRALLSPETIRADQPVVQQQKTPRLPPGQNCHLNPPDVQKSLGLL